MLSLDQGFQLPSVPTATTEAHSAAVKLKEWMELVDNQAELERFSSGLVLDLKQFLPPTTDSLTKAKKETMWRKYYQYRISNSFQSLWKDFVHKHLSVSAQPLMYQYITEKIFQEMIEITFRTHKAASSTAEEFTYEEANVLRYVAGYVCFKIRKNILSSSHPMKDKILFCLMDLCDEDDAPAYPSDWINAIDRGGLVCVSENTCLLFHSIERVVRRVYNRETMETMTDGVKQRLSDAVLADDDVRFYWCLQSVEIGDAEGEVLLKMIVNLFRGFSFAKSVMEMYKQENKKCTQKSKSLRRKLIVAHIFCGKVHYCEHFVSFTNM